MFYGMINITTADHPVLMRTIKLSGGEIMGGKIKNMKRTLAAQSAVRPSLGTRIKRTWQLYILLIPCVAYLVIFKYWPIYGIQIAFRDYNFTQGFFGSDWVGLEHFQRFFNSPDFWRIIKNTMVLSLMNIAFSFPFPILFALMLNQVNNIRYKKIVQTVSYAPYFISTVVLVGMILIVLSPSYGLVNHIIAAVGGEKIFFMAKPKAFKWIYVISILWQRTGYNSIIYIAALTSINPELHEAAVIDGASRLQRIFYIDLPGIMPTAVIMLILATGRILSVGYEMVYLMQNPINLPAAEIISTYVYKRGILTGEFSYSTAINLFQSVINLIMLLTVNKIAKKVSGSSLF